MPSGAKTFKQRRLTKKEVADHLKDDGECFCPFSDCESGDIEGESVEIDANGASQKTSCNCCGRSWTDLYTLTGVLSE